MINKYKKSQQETIGFALIIIIVAVIGLGFLWFMLRPGVSESQSSREITDLLTSGMYYTSDCITTYAPRYEDGQELIIECYKNADEKCLDGRGVCQALNQTLKKVIEESLDVDEDSPNKAYKLSGYYRIPNSDKPDDVFLSLDKGRFANCSSRYGGTHYIYYGSGTIELKLELCKNLAS